jgi:hypothetical protein
MTDEEFKQAVQDKIAQFEKTGEYYDFSGQNCDGPCPGWDGSSRRCACGNRRVSWVCDDFSDGIYAEAW